MRLFYAFILLVFALVGSVGALPEEAKVECRDFPVDPLNKCNHVRNFCSGPELVSGRFNYLEVTYCHLGGMEWLGAILMLLILACVFVVSGTISSEYLLPNTATISRMLQLPDIVAGLTVIAIGNAMPDLIGNLISLRSGGDDPLGLAIGNVLGSILFLICVVYGVINVMADGQKVTRAVIFYNGYLAASVVVFLIIIIDGRLTFVEGVVMVSMYGLYIMFAVGSTFIPSGAEKLSPSDLKLTVIDIEAYKRADKSADGDIVVHRRGIRIPLRHRTSSKEIPKKYLIRAERILDYVTSINIPMKLKSCSLDLALLTLRAIDALNQMLDPPSPASAAVTRKIYHNSESLILKPFGNLHRIFSPEEPELESLADSGSVERSFSAESFIEYCPTCSTLAINTGTPPGKWKTIKYHFFPLFSQWPIRCFGGKLIGLLSFVPNIILSASTIVIGPESYLQSQDNKMGRNSFARSAWPHAWIVAMQAFLAPFVVSAAFDLFDNDIFTFEIAGISLHVVGWILAFAVGLVLCVLVLLLSFCRSPPFLIKLLSIVGMTTALSWSYFVSLEAVSILKAIGVVTKLSNTVLGMTLFVYGNNIGDLVSALASIKLGMHNVAVGTSIGSPIMNLLINMAVIILYLGVGAPYGYHIEVSNLTISLFAVIFVVISINMLGVAMRGFRLFRLHGIAIIILYLVSIIIICSLSIAKLDMPLSM